MTPPRCAPASQPALVTDILDFWLGDGLALGRASSAEEIDFLCDGPRLGQ